MGFTQAIMAFAVRVMCPDSGLFRSLAFGHRRSSPAGRRPTPMYRLPAGLGLSQLALATTQGTGSAPPPTAGPPSHAAAADVEELAHHMPRPTIWPAVIAFGATLLGFGVMSSLTFAVCGAVLLLIGVGGWIVELRHA